MPITQLCSIDVFVVKRSSARHDEERTPATRWWCYQRRELEQTFSFNDRRYDATDTLLVPAEE